MGSLELSEMFDVPVYLTWSLYTIFPPNGDVNRICAMLCILQYFILCNVIGLQWLLYHLVS